MLTVESTSRSDEGCFQLLICSVAIPMDEAVPSAFTRLAERNVSVSRFSLSVEGDDLLFTLQLETPHEG